MDSRREFIKKAAVLAGGTGLMNALPESIQKALAINPAKGTSFYDAEHVVILMQENRSFDHALGSLQGVRGFNDPRAMRLANGNPVWLQSNAEGQTFAPFRLDIKNTKATWMKSLPHSWEDQVDALNGGKNDGWLGAKRSGIEEYEKMPLTLGYYDRDDIPFYYSLADAFTVCDQNFCSSLTGTTPNRLYLWTGTIRETADFEAKANVKNEDVGFEKMVHWRTAPDVLEDAGISWRIYQNELSMPTGLSPDEEDWLCNFTDNPIEWFSQFNVFSHKTFQDFVKKELEEKPNFFKELEDSVSVLIKEGKLEEAEKLESKRKKMLTWKKMAEDHNEQYFLSLKDQEKNRHIKAFTTNAADSDYRTLAEIAHESDGRSNQIQIPKGDVFHQFRADVNNGTLPTVSWLVAPANFSDHPGAPWYGAWYVSEAMDILTKNSEVWKKTIFILCYDENDGYFDHIPPFLPPRPNMPASGKVSDGIDTSVEMANIKHELERHDGEAKDARDGAIGLGFRVPLLLASPWSRGGFVNSEVFDHTSILQFLENFLSKKAGEEIRFENISDWRRTVCGDLTSAFREYNGEKMDLPAFIEKISFVESIYDAQFKKLPSGFRSLTKEETGSGVLPKQEAGVRNACALGYDLRADGFLKDSKFTIRLEAANTGFTQKSEGAPFMVFVRTDNLQVRHYAVKTGQFLTDEFNVADFHNGRYHLEVQGPNGFWREFTGTTEAPALDIKVLGKIEGKGTNNTEVVQLMLENMGAEPLALSIRDESYGAENQLVNLSGHERKSISFDVSKSYGWYDLGVTSKGHNNYAHRYAGHVESSKSGKTDPLMGKELKG